MTITEQIYRYLSHRRQHRRFREVVDDWKVDFDKSRQVLSAQARPLGAGGQRNAGTPLYTLTVDPLIARVALQDVDEVFLPGRGGGLASRTILWTRTADLEVDENGKPWWPITPPSLLDHLKTMPFREVIGWKSTTPRVMKMAEMTMDAELARWRVAAWRSSLYPSVAKWIQAVTEAGATVEALGDGRRLSPRGESLVVGADETTQLFMITLPGKNSYRGMVLVMETTEAAPAGAEAPAADDDPPEKN